MDRRAFLAGSAALAATAALPAFPAFSHPAIVWMPGTRTHHHTAIVAEGLGSVLRQGVLYTAGETRISNYAITLRDPRFIVSHGQKVWRVMDGYGDEISLGVKAYEGGIEIGDMGLVSTEGTSLTADHGLYYLRAPWFPYEGTEEKRKALGDRMGYDMRWFEHLKQTNI